ncbi:TPA: hypothetical protein ACQDQ8_005011 [Serratia marcescens]
MDKFNYLKEQLTAALATWQQTNGGKTTVGWMHAANPEVIAALLAELEREQEMRAQNLEIKTLLAEKVKTLETKLWDSQQLVDAKSHSQIELRSQISNLEERNRKDMSSRGKRICELDDLLEAANKRIAELERSRFIEWPGNMFAPVLARIKVDVKRRDGSVSFGLSAGNVIWHHSDSSSDVVAFALAVEGDSE